MSRCASRRKPSTAEKSRTIRIVSARHAARPVHSPHSASILDLALPHYRTAPGRIPATNRAAWYPTAHSCATSDTNESLHPIRFQIELQHAAINQPGNQSAGTKHQRLVCRSGNKPVRAHALAESNRYGIPRRMRAQHQTQMTVHVRKSNRGMKQQQQSNKTTKGEAKGEARRIEVAQLS